MYILDLHIKVFRFEPRGSVSGIKNPANCHSYAKQYLTNSLILVLCVFEVGKVNALNGTMERVWVDSL